MHVWTGLNPYMLECHIALRYFPVISSSALIFSWPMDHIIDTQTLWFALWSCTPIEGKAERLLIYFWQQCYLKHFTEPSICFLVWLNFMSVPYYVQFSIPSSWSCMYVYKCCIYFCYYTFHYLCVSYGCIVTMCPDIVTIQHQNSHYWSFVQESTSDWWISPHKSPVMEKAIQWHGVIMFF